ncbi:hypothetical protein [Niallia sp. 03133]|uniref:hypothetical protein n=1 Tax=Niallia sp. 03133 TaxID=3458060 RepID=UPI004044792A
MSLARLFVGIWKSYEETSEQATSPELKTRYYNKNREKMIEYVKQIVNQKLPNWKITKIDAERGEIIIEKKQGFTSIMVVTIYKISVIQTAMDVYCSKEGRLGDFGTSYKHILSFFDALHTEIQPERV